MSKSLVEQYRNQNRWRSWDRALRQLPLRAGQRVVDLGCGVGHVSARLSDLGLDVLGVDVNEDLLAEARSAHSHVRFEHLDLKDVAADRMDSVDGMWGSFVAAYFPDLDQMIRQWSACLRVGGWLALVEVDDLFGHEPFPPRFRHDVARFYESTRQAGTYDFYAGRKLVSVVRTAGLEVIHHDVLPDEEFSFAGAAPPAVLEGWRERLHRMGVLQVFLGGRFGDFEGEFMAMLASEEHVSNARLFYVVARRTS